MKRCVCLLGVNGNSQVTIMKDDCVLADFYGQYSLDKFLLNTSIDVLDVIYRPIITSTVPEEGLNISIIEINKARKTLVISDEDVRAMVDYSALYGIGQVKVHSFLDIVVDRFKNYDKVIVIFEWASTLTGLAYIELGKLKDFKRIRNINLVTDLTKFRQKYKCEVVSFDKTYDITQIRSYISNASCIDKSMLGQISHIPYIMEAKGKIISDSSVAAFNLATTIGSSINEIKEVLVPNGMVDDVEEDFDTPDDYGDLPKNPKPKEPRKGFFSSLFKKKPKAKFDFKTVEQTKYDKLSDDELFSLLADGKITEHELRTSKGKYSRVASSSRNGTGLQYIAFTMFSVVTAVALTFTVLNAVYVGQDNFLSGEYDSLIKVKNKIETTVKLSEDPTSSPAIRLAQISSLELPSGYSVKTIDYSDQRYILMMSVDNEVTVDEVRNYLPDDMKIGKISEMIGEQYSGDSNKMYEIVLVIS